VIPGAVEDELRKSPLISQCLGIGDQRPFISALVTLDAEALERELPRLGLDPGLTPEQAAEKDAVKDEIQNVIDRTNENVSRAESIRAFRIIAQDFTEESGHMTPSLKIRRPQVLKDYSDVVESIYAAGKPS
ncbi:MAG: long-chain fatty acid--CoA ligase, partial [Kocuria sp.]|nr:long-chain fatty acid--CoA ligase [Kocuria sp.]